MPTFPGSQPLPPPSSPGPPPPSDQPEPRVADPEKPPITAHRTPTAARVVPAVPSFAVDNGFWYSLPPDRADDITVGSLVRVPLGGRRTRGFVVETTDSPPRPPAKLRPIGPLVMKLPVFDQALLSALEWAANRYVAPLSVLLERAAPPNLANQLPDAATVRIEAFDSTHPLADFAAAVARGQRRPATVLLSRWEEADWLGAAAGPILAAGQSLMVIVATGAEAALLGARQTSLFAPALVTVTPDSSNAEVTTAWTQCQTPGRLLIGTPRVASWLVADLRLIVVVEEGRRAMKDRQTPTISVRDLARTRASISGLGLAFVGPTPTAETIATGPTIVRLRRRAWPSVEIVDRRHEEITGGLVGLRALTAIRAVLERGGNVFAFAHRRGYAPAYRCRHCRTLRRCPRCGSRPEPGSSCARCGAAIGSCPECGSDQFVPLGAGVGRVAEELRRKLGDRSDERLAVGSEADLASLGPQDLVVAVDADGLILGTHYRAAEEALRVLARLVGKVGGPASRGLIQTSLPDHPVIVSLRSGDPIPFLEGELESRRSLGLPPAGQLLVLETRGTIADPEPLADIAAEVSVLGPITRFTPNGEPAQRWLIQGRDLGNVRLRLRPLVERWRQHGTVVRVDSDPIDL